jgi:hypothetical protein
LSQRKGELILEERSRVRISAIDRFGFFFHKLVV